MPKRMVYDRWLFVTTAVLVVVGLFMVGSSSNYVAIDSGQSPSVFLWKQAFHLLFGAVAFLVMLSVPYQKLADRKLVGLLLAGAAGSLLLVLTLPAVNNAHRWIELHWFSVQPSEFVKLIAIVFMAYLLSRNQDRVNEPWSVPVPSLIVVGTLAFLIVIEPDLGSGVMLVIVACAMIFVAGLRFKYIAVLGALGAVGFVASVAARPYRLERIKAFLDPSADPLDASFQLNQSLIAVGSGGLSGAGLGQGTQKALYLPAAHTDFIFSVLGEEFGLIGTSAVLLLFLLLFWRGIRAAVRAPDGFGFYLALGLTCLLVLQALINMSICVGLLPTKGLPLPFISYGGSSLLASLTAMGMLLNVSQHSN